MRSRGCTGTSSANVRAWKAGRPFTSDGSKYAKVEDGWAGIAFIETCVKSSRKKGPGPRCQGDLGRAAGLKPPGPRPPSAPAGAAEIPAGRPDAGTANWRYTGADGSPRWPDRMPPAGPCILAAGSCDPPRPIAPGSCLQITHFRIVPTRSATAPSSNLLTRDGMR